MRTPERPSATPRIALRTTRRHRIRDAPTSPSGPAIVDAQPYVLHGLRSRSPSIAPVVFGDELFLASFPTSRVHSRRANSDNALARRATSCTRPSYYSRRLTAPNEAALGCGQLGTHIGSLGPPSIRHGVRAWKLTRTAVTRESRLYQEPMSLTLLGSGLVALAARSRSPPCLRLTSKLEPAETGMCHASQILQPLEASDFKHPESRIRRTWR